MGLREGVRIFVENEAGSDLRHIYDEATFQLLRTQPVAAAYPYPYGFILETTTEDGGAVDCFVLTASPIPTGSALEGEPVGLLEQFENGEVDHKILVALPGSAPHLDPNLHQTLRSFIGSLFEPFPLVHVEVGRILGAHEARAFIASHRTHGPGLTPDTST